MLQNPKHIFLIKIKATFNKTPSLKANLTGGKMFLNYLKIALRNFRKQKIYSSINLIGLAVGITCSFLILLYVIDETSYDKFYKNSGRIYEVVQGEELESEITPSIISPLFKKGFPEIEESARIYNYTLFGPVIISYQENKFQENSFYFADSTLTEIFSFNFIYGEPFTSLNRPNTVVITEKISQKYFGNENPLGKTIKMNNEQDFEITGVIKNLPSNSHLHFDFMASLHTRKGWSQLTDEKWEGANFNTYVLLQNENLKTSLEEKIPALIKREIGDELEKNGRTFRLGLMPLTDIHLIQHGNITYVYLFSGIAVLILLIACINYMNLATARAINRAREVGMRKVLGAFRKQLIGQFYGESFFLAFLSVIIAAALIKTTLPIFNGISNKELVINFLSEPTYLVLLLIIGIIVGFISGSYPALLLSSFIPSKVLKGTFKTSASGIIFRKGLVVFQFLVSVFLIVATTVIYTQLKFMQNKNLGFTREQILILPIGDKDLLEKYETLKGELLKNTNIKTAAAISSYPGYMLGGYSITGEGLPDNVFYETKGIAADKEILQTLDVELIAGSSFPATAATPAGDDYHFIINEKIVKNIGWKNEEAVGKSINMNGRKGTVSGVMKDFNFESLHKEIGPLTFFYQPQNFEYLLVKLNTYEIANTLSFIKNIWNELAPHRPFEYLFLDQEYEQLYKTEERAGKIFSSFSTLAILIACLGLLGLASFAAEQKKKEIGIRKVLGASASSIVVLLSKEFTKLVLAATVIAIPLSFFAMDKWLQNFAFKISIGYEIILFAIISTLLIALITISFQTIKISLLNPAKVLKDE